MKKIILSAMLIILATGCGDLFMKNGVDNEAELDQFATCELDIDAFSYILEKNIKGDLVCLQEQLDLFMDVIRTDRPGYISKSVLKEFLVDGPIDVEDDIVDVVDSLFDLSFLILGTDKNFIKRQDVYTLIDFLIYFNEHIWRSYRYFVSDDDVNYKRHLKERQIVFNEFALITQKLRSIYKADRSTLDRINTEEFIFHFFKGDLQTLEEVRSLMFLKRVFLGGQVWDLTHVEFSRGLEVIPYLAQAAFDIAKTKNYEFKEEQETLIKVFMRDVEIIKDAMYFDGSSHESLFTIYDAINAVMTLQPDLKDDIDLAKYPREIMKLKEIALGSGGEFVSSKELVALLDHMLNVFDEANTFYRIYDFYRDDLNSPDAISHDFSDFPLRNDREIAHRDNFARLASDYKYFKGEAIAPYFSHDYRRNANAFFQIGTMEYVIAMIFDFYGSANPQARGGYKYDMTLEESVEMIKDFKWVLKDFGIVNIGRKGGGEIQGVADNLVLMSTLFQNQSDGCGDSVCMEVPETTEFALGLLTAIEVKDFFTEAMLDKCAAELDEYDRIDPECFRRNFIAVIEEPIPEDREGRAIKDFMPLLYQYLQELTQNIPAGEPITQSEDYMKFILETEAFTRTCSFYDEEETEEVPMKANDAFAVFAGLLNVESTLLRFDFNQNNKMDGVNGFNEVMHAYYNVYEGAIKGLVAPNGGFMEKLAKPIFKYLIKRGEVPDTSKFSSIWKFVKFLFKWNKKADASRTTIATILKTIGEQSETAKTNPFKCEECLRDPTVECTPEGDDWEPRVTPMTY